MPSLRVMVLGGFQARLASGATMRLPKKAQALLAYLGIRPARATRATSSRPCCGARRAGDGRGNGNDGVPLEPVGRSWQAVEGEAPEGFVGSRSVSARC